MGLFRTNKILNCIDKMIDNAIEGKSITNTFDESKLSALEMKFETYLNANGTSKKQLQKEKANINAYISDISHQTKTPMANIMLYTQLLGESDLSKDNQKLVSAINSQTEKLNFLIASLVKSSRLETGIISINLQKNKISTLLSSVVAQILPQAKAKNIDIHLQNSDIEAMFDSKWTAEAVYNLLDNAVKYTPDGGVIKVSAISYQMFCRINVEDTGIGIAEEEIAKVFTRFYRSGDVAKIEGVGIGLYLSREIVSKQGGYIKVKSQVGKGSTFSVFLPIE